MPGTSRIVYGDRVGGYDFSSGKMKWLLREPNGKEIACFSKGVTSSFSVLWSKDGDLSTFDSQGKLLSSDLCGDDPWCRVFEDECRSIKFGSNGALVKRRNREIVVLTKSTVWKRLIGDREIWQFHQPNIVRREELDKREHQLWEIDDSGALEERIWFSRASIEEFSRPVFSGKYVLLQTSKTKVEAHMLTTGELIQSFDAAHVGLRDDHIVLEKLGGGRTFLKADTLKKVLETKVVAPLLDRLDRLPWAPATAEGGYAIFDLRTEKLVGNFGSSPYGCGYEFGWFGDTFVFLEGGRVSFWSEEDNASTHVTGCVGYYSPRLSADGKYLFAFDTLFELANRKPIHRFEPPIQQLFAQEKFGMSSDSPNDLGLVIHDVGRRRIAYRYRFGGLGAHRSELGLALVHGELDEPSPFLMVVDPNSGKAQWLLPVVTAQDGSARLDVLSLPLNCSPEAISTTYSNAPDAELLKKYCSVQSVTEEN